MFKQLILQVVLILLNAFFAATEIAVISLNEKKVRALASEGDKRANKMLKIIESPTQFLSTIQIGITLAGFLGSAFAADNFAETFSAFLIRIFHIAPQYAGTMNTVAVVAVTLILSYFTLILGELVPKRIAMKHKEALANGVCGLISGLTTVLKPIIWFLTVSTNAVLRLFGINPNEKEEPVSEEDIVLMLDAGGDEGTLDQDDIAYIKNVFKLDRMTAEDVMTPWKSVVFITENAKEEEILSLIKTEAYSRIPVYDAREDRILGILHTRDYLLERRNPGFSLQQVLHEPVIVPETLKLDTLFKEMQRQHNHVVILVNEYGETSGIVSMEDILEEIVGEIWDERDEEVSEITETGKNTYRVLSAASVEDFFEFFDMEEPETEAATVNGWLTEQAGCIPKVGDSFTFQKLKITVTKADELMTHELTVHLETPAADAIDAE